jgi:hypothetical protein
MNSEMFPMHGGQTAPVWAGCFMIFVILFALGMNILMLIAMCKIFAKAGYHWAMGLLPLVPVVGFFVPLYLAFSEWPIEKKLKTCQQQTPSEQSGNFRTL